MDLLLVSLSGAVQLWRKPQPIYKIILNSHFFVLQVRFMQIFASTNTKQLS